MDKGRIAEIEELRSFLSQVRKVAASPGGFVLIRRSKNMQALAEYGLPRDFPKQVVMKLSIRNYSYTDKDVNGSGEVWIFGGKIMDVPFYIKIKLETIDGRSIVKCLSFHPEDSPPPLTFPYKTTKVLNRR